MNARPTTALVDNREGGEKAEGKNLSTTKAAGSPRYLTIAENGNEKKGAHRLKGKMKTVLRDPECQRHGGLAKQKGHRPRNKLET